MKELQEKLKEYWKKEEPQVIETNANRYRWYKDSGVLTIRRTGANIFGENYGDAFTEKRTGNPSIDASVTIPLLARDTAKAKEVRDMLSGIIQQIDRAVSGNDKRREA